MSSSSSSSEMIVIDVNERCVDHIFMHRGFPGVDCKKYHIPRRVVSDDRNAVMLLPLILRPLFRMMIIMRGGGLLRRLKDVSGSSYD